jgi:aspartate racemase
MRTLGLIGGTTWHSTVDYYRTINQLVNARLGGLHSARLLLASVDFQEFQPAHDPAGWTRIADGFVDLAKRLAHAGADCLVLCANTPHLLADVIAPQIPVPLIHIAEATGRAIQAKQMRKIALLGTKFTMEHGFFQERLARAGIETLVPGDDDRAFIHRSIFEELGHGVFTAETRAAYLAVIDRLHARGAEGVILGCTEIPMLIKPEDCPIPSFDTTVIHATAAVDFALA